MRTRLEDHIKRSDYLLAATREASAKAMDHAGWYEKLAAETTDPDRREDLKRTVKLMRDHAKMYARDAEKFAKEIERLRDMAKSGNWEGIG